MFSTVIQKFAQRLSPPALVITFVGGMSGMALVACFAPDLVEYFAASSVSIAPWRTEFELAAFDLESLPVPPASLALIPATVVAIHTAEPESESSLHRIALLSAYEFCERGAPSQFARPIKSPAPPSAAGMSGR